MIELFPNNIFDLFSSIPLTVNQDIEDRLVDRNFLDTLRWVLYHAVDDQIYLNCPIAQLVSANDR